MAIPTWAWKLWYEHEGGATDDPLDLAAKGSPRPIHTKYGITWKTFKKYYPGRFVETCTIREARWILGIEFWARYGMDEWPRSLQGQFFDMAGNAGGSNATKCLQRGLNDMRSLAMVPLVVDGGFGPKTKRRFASLERYRDAVAGAFIAERGLYYRRLRQYPRYKHSWMRRLTV